MELTRDNLCIALSELYGTPPEEYDGMTFAEISQYVTPWQLEEAYRYMGVSLEDGAGDEQHD